MCHSIRDPLINLIHVLQWFYETSFKVYLSSFFTEKSKPGPVFGSYSWTLFKSEDGLSKFKCFQDFLGTLDSTSLHFIEKVNLLPEFEGFNWESFISSL